MRPPTFAAAFAAALTAALTVAHPAGAIEEIWRIQPSPDGYDVVVNQVLVLPWQDRNGDGRIDVDDGGDVIALTQDSTTPRNAVLRVLDGRTGVDLWPFERPSFADVDHDTAFAAGDVDGDGFPEIAVAVFSTHTNYLQLYDWDGSLRWFSTAEAEFSSTTHRALSLADLDGDGISEILASNTVFNIDGTVRRVLDVPPCRESYAIDVDLDGALDIVCGTNVARADGSVLVMPSRFHGSSAIAQLDDDPHPEILSRTTDHAAVAIDQDSSFLWQLMERTGGTRISPATFDLEGDGLSEFFIAKGNADGTDWPLAVHDATTAEIWQVSPTDTRPHVGSAFYLAGSLVVAHQDEDAVRVHDARDGTLVLEIPNEQLTAWEVPVFADLDGDGRGELITTSTEPGIGVRAWSDESWCDARPVWHQHAYAPVLIGDDLRPTSAPVEPVDWARVGWRLQEDGCACIEPPESVAIVAEPGCGADVACVSAEVVGGTPPFEVEWLLPDGSTSIEERPCFSLSAPESVSLVLRDARGCEVTTDTLVEPPAPRSLVIAAIVECGSSIQCFAAVPEALPGPLDLTWTLPDGSTSNEAEPCFPIGGPETVALVAIDADGCAWSTERTVDEWVEPPLVELSASGATRPLRLEKAGAELRLTWEASSSGLTVVAWEGALGDWSSHVGVACVDVLPIASIPLAAGDRYHLVGELSCDGTSGPLGPGRARPATLCP